MWWFIIHVRRGKIAHFTLYSYIEWRNMCRELEISSPRIFQPFILTLRAYGNNDMLIFSFEMSNETIWMRNDCQMLLEESWRELMHKREFVYVGIPRELHNRMFQRSSVQNTFILRRIFLLNVLWSHRNWNFRETYSVQRWEQLGLVHT